MSPLTEKLKCEMFRHWRERHRHRERVVHFRVRDCTALCARASARPPPPPCRLRNDVVSKSAHESQLKKQ